jgi:primosomal protein N'
MTERPYTARLPKVKMVDMKDEDPDTLISEYLKNKILDRLEKKEQIFFSNRAVMLPTFSASNAVHSLNALNAISV